MSDPITDRAVYLLSKISHILVSLEELYLVLESEGLMAWMPFGLFVALMSADERVDVIDELGDYGLFESVLEEELEMRGLLHGPLVALRSRASSPEALMHDVLEHLQEMNQALEMAWYLRPDDDPEIEAELLDMLMMGDMLEREVKHALHLDPYPQNPVGVSTGASRSDVAA